MSERDELKARLDARGVEFDRRLGVERLRELDEATAHLDDDLDDEEDLEDEEVLDDDLEDLDEDEEFDLPEPDEAPEPAPTPPAASTLRRVAPNVWVDGRGRRQVGR